MMTQKPATIADRSDCFTVLPPKCPNCACQLNGWTPPGVSWTFTSSPTKAEFDEAVHGLKSHLESLQGSVIRMQRQDRSLDDMETELRDLDRKVARLGRDHHLDSLRLAKLEGESAQGREIRVAVTPDCCGHGQVGQGGGI